MDFTLAPFTRDEVEIYHRWVCDQDVIGPFVAREDQALVDLLARFDENQWLGPEEYFYSYKNSQGELAGYAHFWKCDKYESHFEFGRVLIPAFRGKGLGVKFLSQVIDQAFTTCDTARLQAITACDNAVVLAHWGKVGISVEGTLRQFMTLPVGMVDCKIGSILRSEWLSERGRL